MKRTYLILIIMMLIIGFAAVTTNLVINGNINIGFNEDEFKVYFSYAKLGESESDNLISKDKQSITFTATKSSILEFDITNESSQYDAVVSVNCEPETNENYRLESNVKEKNVEAKELVTGKVNVETNNNENLEITCTLDVVAVSRTEENTGEVKKRCDFDIGTEWTFDYKDSAQEFDVPCNGTYKLEVWGAQGGNFSSSCQGGYGAYSTGNVKLDSMEQLFVVVGGSGQGDGQHGYRVGGYNGGGNAFADGDAHTRQGSGGGATHIALIPGLLSTLVDQQNEILIVAGGGGGAAANSVLMCSSGGTGGGINGGNSSTFMEGNSYAIGLGATQTAGGNCQSNRWPCTSGNFGLGASDGQFSGGGGGYYGGGAVVYAGGGGSGYIGNPLLFEKGMWCYQCETSEDENTKTTSTANVSTEPISQYAKQGNGYAKITLVSLN